MFVIFIQHGTFTHTFTHYPAVLPVVDVYFLSVSCDCAVRCSLCFVMIYLLGILWRIFTPVWDRDRVKIKASWHDDTQLLIQNESRRFEHFAVFTVNKSWPILWLDCECVQIMININFSFFQSISHKTPSLILYLFFHFFAAFFTGTESKMKLWDVLATCLLLLSSVATRPLYQNTQPAKRTNFPSSYSDSASLSVEDEEPTFQREDHNLQEISMEDQCKAHSMFTQNLLWCAGTVMASWMVDNWRTWGSLHRSVLLVQNLCEMTCD